MKLKQIDKKVINNRFVNYRIREIKTTPDKEWVYFIFSDDKAIKVKSTLLKDVLVEICVLDRNHYSDAHVCHANILSIANLIKDLSFFNNL